MKELFTLNMEKYYVPTAKVVQKQEMMGAWNRTNDILRKLCFVSAFADLLPVFSRCFYTAPAALIMVICGFLIRQNNKKVYYATALSGLIIAAAVYASEGGKVVFTMLCADAAVFMLPLFFAFKCLYNYESVFVPLSKSKGFPHFVFSTTDIYGKKMYIRDGEKSVAAEREKESFNSFNTARDAENERFERSQNLVAEKKVEAQTLDILDGENKPKKEVTYKYGKMLGSFELVFLHNDIPTLSYYEKKLLINKWNAVVDGLSNEFATKLFLILGIMIILLISFGKEAILLWLSVLLLIFGTNNIKMGKLHGVFYVIAAALISLFPAVMVIVQDRFEDVTGKLAMAFTLILFAVFVPSMLRAIHLWLNRDIYRQLKKEKGFPSFVQTATEEFASEMYVAAQPMPTVDKSKTNDEPIVMNIGFDEKKERKKAWNAFDYMDNEEDKNENNAD